MLRRLVLLLAFFVLPLVVQAQQESNIYLIKMFGCTHTPVERSQTGFRVRGVKGLVTALHGVADCQRITASSRQGLILDQPLTVKKIDLDHDAALLSSPQVESAQDGGFEVADNIAWESLGTVRVYGHPYGISSLETMLTVRNPSRVSLKELVPAGPLSVLKERRSPNHLTNVLNLQGNLLPGHSGAPVLDSGGRVVAVANGGLKEGFAGISWAIPYREIDWDNVGNRLKTLAQLDPNILFASDAISTQPPEDETCGQLSRLILESQTGFISIVGDPLGENSGFRSKIHLTGALLGYIYPNKYAGYNMYNSDRINWVESQYYVWVSKVLACFPGWQRKELDTGVTPKTLRSVFRENDKSSVIEVSYNMEPSTVSTKYSLHLTVYAIAYRKTWD